MIAAAGVDAATPAGTLRGKLGRTPALLVVELVRWLTGWALVAWVLRLVATTLGFTRWGELWLEGDVLRVRREISFWGKPVRRSEEAYPIASIVGVRRHVRYPALRLAVAAFAFGVGALAGSVLFLDGLRTGTGSLVALAAGALAAGAGLDFVLRAWLPGARGRVAVAVDLAPRSGLRISDADAGAADALVADLARRWSKPSTDRSVAW